MEDRLATVVGYAAKPATASFRGTDVTAVVLHLSDIHIKSSGDWILDKASSIAACVYSSLPDASVVLVIVSGDIAFSGKPDQYNEAEKLFLGIRAAIETEKKMPVHFAFCAGNHDCDFSLGNKTRTLALNGVRADPSQFDDSILATGASVQSAYREFANKLASAAETRVGDDLWTCHRFTVEGKEIVIDSINVAWCSNLHEEPGTLIFPHERYVQRLHETVDIRLSVLHHPLNWFSQASYRPFRELIRGVANVVISGHEHVGGVGEDLHSDSGHSAYIEGCVLQSDKPSTDSSFNVAIFSLDDGTYRSTRYQWSADGGYCATDVGSWSDFRALPKKARNRFQLTDSFVQILSDPGGVFQSKGSPLTLADLYVPPDMQETTGRVEQKRILSTSVIEDAGRLDGGVLLTGEEKVGTTSLLFMLFQTFHARGLVPVYVRGADIKGSADKDIDLAVRKAVADQYGTQSAARFDQTPAAQKVLLLDDFDDGPVKASIQRARMLALIAVRFPRFVITANEVFDFDGSVRPHAKDALKQLKDYRVLPMGYSLRARLVKRWFQRTASDGTMTEDTMLAKCDQAERLLDAILARNVVPSLPLYLLTLLQSIDAGSSSGFEESGLGEYYDFLVKEGLRTAGVQKQHWGSMIEYCSHLAWQLHASEHKEVTIDDLRAFNDRFSKEQHRVDFDTRLKDLLRARILAQHDQYVRFRYHYIYYFLKGRYLASQLEDLVTQAYIRECCAHLYVRENANTILFLAHHAFKNPMFLDCVIQAVTTPFRASSPIQFNGSDTASLADFIRDLPKLAYNGEDPESMRDKTNRSKDELDDGHDGLIDDKQIGEELDFLAELIALFKTVEILGQIVKNQIASVPREKRVQLLKLLMQGPLRALTAYFDMFMADRDVAEREIAAMLEKRHAISDENERQEIAKRLLAHFLQLVSYGFVAKAVSSISSDALQEDVDAAAKSLNSPAARLIALGVRLDGPSKLPRTELSKAIDETQGDFMAARVLQFLTLRRLYMFRTSAQDQQWLASQDVLDIKVQQAVSFRTRRTKLLK
jgi:Calcineurin-like phosphoesterase